MKTEELFELAHDRIQHLTRVMVEKSYSKEEYGIAVIDYKAPSWRSMINHLMPDTDWEAVMNGGGHPVATGIVQKAYMMAETMIQMPEAVASNPDIPNTKLTHHEFMVFVFVEDMMSILLIETKPERMN